MPKDIRTVVVISSSKVTLQEYPATYLICEWKGVNVGQLLKDNTQELVVLIPPGFDFGDEYILDELIEEFSKHRDSQIFYTDYLVKKSDDKIAQFLPAITPEIINNNFVLDVPILFCNIQDNLIEFLRDKTELCWEILKLSTTNGVLSYHKPKFFFIKNDSTS